MAAEKKKLIDGQQRGVEAAISLDGKAAKMEEQLRAFSEDRDGFRQQARLDRIHWRLRLIFWGSVVLYVLAEYITSGDLSEWLANQLAPLFHIAAADGATPTWLRWAAGGVFVGTMLGVTLLLKFVTTWYVTAFREQLATVPVGEHTRHWSLTAGIFTLHSAKVVYMAMVAGLYIWLFGFAQERAAITAAIATEQKQSLEWSDLGLKIEGGTIETNEAVPQKTASTPPVPAVGSKLAWGTGVLYVMLWALHGLVLLLPTDGFGRPLELAHFKPGAVEKRAGKLRETEEQILRDLHEHIHSVEGADRDALIRVTLPVAKRLNEAVGRVVIEVPPAPGTTANGAAPSDPPAGSQMAGGNPPPNDAPVAASFAGDETDRERSPADLHREIFGTSQEGTALS